MIMKSMLASVVVAASLAHHVCVAAQVETTSKDNSVQCECYLASGPDRGYFQNYRFWDFRNISNDGANDFSQAPDLVTTDQNQGTEAVTSSYFNSTEFLADWAIATGVTNRNSPIASVDSAQNIYISRNSTSGENDTYLTLRTSRQPDFVSRVELVSNEDKVLHCSIRGRFRVIPNSLSNSAAPFAGERVLNNADSGSNDTHPVDNGAVFGFFTYRSDTQESDIELLTSDSIDSIRYSNQPDYDSKTDESIPGASTQATLPDGLVWTEWQDQRIDWFEGVSRWYINDKLVLEKTLNVPTEPSALILNLWSDGGNWSGNMTVGSQVTVGIEWIEMAYNTTSKASGKREVVFGRRNQGSCQLGCDIDSVGTVGFPEVAYNSSGDTTPSMGFSVLRSGSNSVLTVSTLATCLWILLTFL